MDCKFLSTPAQTLLSPPSQASGISETGRGPSGANQTRREARERDVDDDDDEASMSPNDHLKKTEFEDEDEDEDGGMRGGVAGTRTRMRHAGGINGALIEGDLENGLLTPESFRVTIPSVDMRLRRVLDLDVGPPEYGVGRARVGTGEEREEEEGVKVRGDEKKRLKSRTAASRWEREQQPLYSPSIVSELQSLDSFGLSPSEDESSVLYADEEREEDDDDGMSTTTVQSSRRATYGAKTINGTATNRTEANTTQDYDYASDAADTDVGYRIPRVAKGKWKARQAESEIEASVAEVDLQDLASPMPKYIILPAQRALDSPGETKVQHRRTSSGVSAAKEPEKTKEEKTRTRVRIESSHHHHHRLRSTHGTRIVYEKGLSKDFFLIMALCLGLACASIVLIRPLIMARFGPSESLEFGILEFE